LIGNDYYATSVESGCSADCRFTWYSLQDQMDWDTDLRENNGRVNSLGLCDLDRNIRPVGHAYKDLIKKWKPTWENEGNILDMYR